MHSRLEAVAKNTSAIPFTLIILSMSFKFESRKVCRFPVMKKRIRAVNVRLRNTVALLLSLRIGGSLLFCLPSPASGSDSSSSSSSRSSGFSSFCIVS